MNFWNKIRQDLFIEQNVFVLSLSILFVIIAFFSWYPILPIYLQELGANDFQVGFSYTLLTLASTLMQFFGGILSDYFGRKWLIVFPNFIFPLLYLLIANINQWQILVALLVVVNSLTALQLPSFYAIIAESVPKNKRGKAYSIFELFVVMGITLGPAVGMILISRINIRYLFYLSAVVTFLCAVIRLIWLKETHHDRLNTISIDSIKKIFNRKIFMVIAALSSLLLLFNLTTNGPFASLFAYEVLHFDKSKINLLFALGGSAAVIYSIGGGKIIEKWGSKKMLSASAIGMGLFAVLWGLSATPFLHIFLFIILYVFFQSCYIAYGALLADITHRQSRGLVIGFIGTITGLIGSMGPSLGAYLRLYFSPISTFWAGLVFALATSLFLMQAKD